MESDPSAVQTGLADDFQFTITQDGAPVDATVTGFSRRDLLIDARGPIRFGDEFRVRINRTGGDSLECVGFAHWTLQTDDQVKAGLWFVERIPIKFLRGKHEGLRSELRYDVNWVLGMQLPGDKELQRVLIKNYSYSGIAMYAMWPIEEGTLVRLWPGVEPEGHAIASPQVRWQMAVTDSLGLFGCRLGPTDGLSLAKYMGTIRNRTSVNQFADVAEMLSQDQSHSPLAQNQSTSSRSAMALPSAHDETRDAALT